jgi:hypothetical protein
MPEWDTRAASRPQRPRDHGGDRAKRLVEHLERAGFVIMKRPGEIGAAALI